MTDGAPDKSDVRSFVLGYAAADESRVRFAWNGKHGTAFEDANIHFRRAVRAFVIADVAAAPIELVRDLYRAETEFSVEAWCIAQGVNILAERILRADPDRFVEDFLAGKYQSFDAHCGSAFPPDDALTVQLLELVRRRLGASDVPDDRRRLLEAGEKLFTSWLDTTKGRPAARRTGP